MTYSVLLCKIYCCLIRVIQLMFYSILIHKVEKADIYLGFIRFNGPNGAGSIVGGATSLSLCPSALYRPSKVIIASDDFLQSLNAWCQISYCQNNHYFS